MPATIKSEPDNIYVLHFKGLVKRSEFGETQKALAREIEAGVKPHLLTILESFEGWERGADWNDYDFLFTHSNEITRIAIVGEPRWETEALAFAGAGFRRAPVKFFPSGQETQARAWLAK